MLTIRICTLQNDDLPRCCTEKVSDLECFEYQPLMPKRHYHDLWYCQLVVTITATPSTIGTAAVNRAPFFLRPANLAKYRTASPRLGLANLLTADRWHRIYTGSATHTYSVRFVRGRTDCLSRDYIQSFCDYCQFRFLNNLRRMLQHPAYITALIKKSLVFNPIDQSRIYQWYQSYSSGSLHGRSSTTSS